MAEAFPSAFKIFWNTALTCSHLSSLPYEEPHKHFSLEVLTEAYPVHKQKSPNLKATASWKNCADPVTKYSQFEVVNGARQIKLRDLDPQPESS